MLRQYVVDAFTEEVFSGNPAAVCVTEAALADELMQKIAIENNLSETAFAVRSGNEWSLRWFTPGGEIDLCGHATLATSAVLLTYYEKDKNEVVYRTRSGRLSVKKCGDIYELDFPAYGLVPVPVTEHLCSAVGADVIEAYMGRDLLCVLEDEKTVRSIQPDTEALLSLDGLLLHVTAPGETYDSVSRTFAPKLKVYEDPVCGSGHCHIVPYWSRRLGMGSLVCCQASSRGGILYCRMTGERVVLGGHAVFFSSADLFV